MTEQRRGASAVIATSLAVLACCVLALTIKVLAGSPIATDQPRVLEQRALEQHVLSAIPSAARETVTKDDIVCPTSIPVEVGRTFECRVDTSPGVEWVAFTIEDDLGSLSTNER